MQRGRVAVLLVILLGAAGYFGYKKYQKYATDPARVAAKQQAAKKEKLAAQEETLTAAQKRDREKAIARAKTDLNDDSALWRRRYQLTDKEQYPLTTHSGVLTEAVALPSHHSPAVYFSPMFGVGGKSTSATEDMESALRFALRPAKGGVPMPINLIPSSYMGAPYERVGKDVPLRDRTPEQYLKDALQLNADVFVYGRAGVVNQVATLQLSMTDLHTSQSDTVNVTKSASELPAILSEATQKVLQFCKVTDADQKQAGLVPDVAQMPGWAGMEAIIKCPDNPDTTAARNLISAAGADVPWVYTRVSAGTRGETALEIANDGLRKWPDDARLLLAKAQALRTAGSYYASHVMFSEFERRQPESLLGAAQLRLSLKAILDQNSDSPILPMGYRGAYQQLDQLVRQYPGNWCLLWDRGVCAANTFSRMSTIIYSNLVQRQKDLTKINAEELANAAQAYAGLPQQALDDFNAAIAIRPDCPQLMLSLLYWHPHLTDGQGDDDPDKTIQWQMPLLARIEILDPENVDGDLYVAEAQSGNTERMLKILKGAADRSHHDPKVMMRIARTLVDPLRKRMDWDYDLDKRERNKHLLVGAPEVPMFVDAIKTGLAADEWMYPAQENLAWLITAADPNYGDFWPTVYNYNNRHWKAARDEQNAGHYEASIEHARRVMEVLSTGEAEILRYYIVRGLWKLQRYREAIYEAELGAYYFPDKPTFHYMFALVAWDMNERLEEAYERAKIAVELQPSNEGAQQIYKKLAKRLGK